MKVIYNQFASYTNYLISGFVRGTKETADCQNATSRGSARNSMLDVKPEIKMDDLCTKFVCPDPLVWM